MATKILDLSQLHFLVVDDNAYMRSILRTILNMLGSPPMIEEDDGASGLQALRTSPFDIAIVN